MHDSRIGGNMDLSEIIEFFTTVAVLGHPLSITRLTLIGNQPPWQSTGLPAKEGQSYSLFADGLIHWSERYPELHGGPEFHLWARINGGRAVNLSAASGTFTADIDGDIEVCIYMGMWGDAFGNLVSGDRLYAPLRGTLDVIVVLYQTEPLQAINAGLARGDAPSIVLAECDRLENPYQPPAGWEYLHETGYSTMFTGQSNDNQPVIHVNARRDQGYYVATSISSCQNRPPSNGRGASTNTRVAREKIKRSPMIIFLWRQNSTTVAISPGYGVAVSMLAITSNVQLEHGARAKLITLFARKPMS
jgi:hypothetical protein